jgi:hypothetical protein
MVSSGCVLYASPRIMGHAHSTRRFVGYPIGGPVPYVLKSGRYGILGSHTQCLFITRSAIQDPATGYAVDHVYTITGSHGYSHFGVLVQILSLK